MSLMGHGETEPGRDIEAIKSAASAGYGITADSEENLLLDTLSRIRLATGLIKPMLTELPGEVRRKMDELRKYRECLEWLQTMHHGGLIRAKIDEVLKP